MSDIIEFDGVYSEQTKHEMYRRRCKAMGILLMIVALILAFLVLLGVYLMKDWSYSVYFVAPVIVFYFSIMHFSGKWKKSIIKSSLTTPFQTHILIDVTADRITSTACGGVNLEIEAKFKISRVKKFFDCGEYYYIVFRLGDVTNSVVCQKDCLIKGTIKDFEELFKGKILTGK